MAPAFRGWILVQHLNVEHLPGLPEEFLIRAFPPPHMRHQEHHIALHEEPQRLYQGVNQLLVVDHVRRHDEVKPRRRRWGHHGLHGGGIAPGERHDGDGAAAGVEEGHVEGGVVAEIGERGGEVGEDGVRWEGCRQGEARGAGPGTELEDAEWAVCGGRAREEMRGGWEEAEERAGGGPELEGEPEGRDGADGDGGRKRREVELVELLIG